MRTRSKVRENAHDRIMEIVGLLLRTIIETPHEARIEWELVKGLEERGYRKTEIDAAIELVFAVPEIINTSSNEQAVFSCPANITTRVFSEIEAHKLGLAVRSRMLQFRMLGLLAEPEWEEVLMQLLFSEAREVGLADLYFTLRKVLDDEERLMLLLPNPIKRVSAMVN